jgi:hypothetical protein
MTAIQLTQRLREQIPSGVDFEIGKLSDKTTWRAVGGTPAQRAAAQAILDAFDPVQEQAAIEVEEALEAQRKAKLTQVADEFDDVKAKVNKHENWTPTVEVSVPSDHTVLMGILAWAIKQGYKP